MSVRVLVSDLGHRTLALATDTHVLLFKHVQTGHEAASVPIKQAKSESPRCMVEFVTKSAIDLKGFRTLTTAKGTLGLITLGDDVFVCVATGSREVATVRPNETVQQIFAVEFYCLNRADYDHAGGYGAGYRDGYREPTPYSNTLFEDEHGNGYDSGESISEHPFMALKKLLSSGTFYYSYNFDLTRRLQDRADADSTLDVSSLDDGLLWNSYMINPLLSFRSRLSDEERAALDHSSLLTSVIRGYAGTLTIPTSANPIRSTKSNYPATLTVISRLSARRAGTRFNARGIDDDGNVANFVETETIFWSPTGICFSYVQVRGSVPIFWESMSTLIPGQQKIQITRSPEATQLSFDRHFEGLARNYGAIYVVNLLSETKPGEVELAQRYNMHLARCSLLRHESGENNEARPDSKRHDLLQKIEFDFHEQSRAAGGYDGAKKIRPLIAESAEGFLYFLTQEIEDEIEGLENGRLVRKKLSRPVMVTQQNGVFRTNCLDCLDRTNLVQGIVSQMALELFLDHRGEIAGSSNLSIFFMRHSSLWADNGDALSKIYAGTGALKSSFTRHGKMSLGGLMADARKSATRLYVNHFEDKGRQNTTDLLLGRLVGQEEVELVDPISDWVNEQLRRRADEFESSKRIRLWVGTYNLNGQMMKDASELRKWLSVRRGEGFEIVVVGFQEIVELSPQQIMNTDPGRRIIWETAVKQTINEYKNEKNEDQYILLRSGQLVGAALMVFVKVSLLSKIKSVEGAIKKTGLSGIAGNKGAVAIRMDVEGTSICFVTAHLAAGFGNYDERNRDYQTIISGLRFQRDRKIEDHEVVIWAGDFNYRIGTLPESARQLIGVYRSAGGKGEKAEEALHRLYNDDQLNIQMVAGQTFPFYQEGKINFLPTYKFDLGKDEYDTSEKARIPAWTDRILYKVDNSKGSDMRQTEYMSVMNLRFSDHRPIYSTFDVTLRVINDEKKAEILKKLYAKRIRQLKDDVEDESDVSEEAEELMGYQSVAPGLPPASSDRKKWWLDGDKPVASRVKPPKEGMMLNPARHGNPWRESSEDDWVMIDRDIGGKEKSKPQPPAPRKAKISDASNIPPRKLEERMQTTPPKPPPSRSRDSMTPPMPGNMAGAWPASRNISMASTLPPTKSSTPPPPPPSRSANRNFSSSTSILDSDPPENLLSSKPVLSRTVSQSSTASSSTISRKVPPLPKPVKPSALASSTSTGTNQISPASTGTTSLRQLSPRPEIENFDSRPAIKPKPTIHSPSTTSVPSMKPKPILPPSVSSVSKSTPMATRPTHNEGEADKPPPLPRRTLTNASIASMRTTSSAANAAGPPLPPRKDTGTPTNTVMPSNDLLGDNDGFTRTNGSGRQPLDEWKPLLPNR
ncbi:Inositol-1,4,5-trisphosphate 5-phosphatase 1 [Neophaeococcomyces mojaviensis]|uniref:Inositol-1,4,5-trisphosphate 5-phosphatase 1 n=1 Tax=Neophaeococcomyces mojaviensis TaxID=3383035 RepID=A0ACC2ZS43_9EURO|nr:Inositol-1,4,5-trisphosphate 5-phosphatase 1 [Knufia sp. JES_112]